jgi:hypothetical protein
MCANRISSPLRWWHARPHFCEAAYLIGCAILILVMYLDRLSYLGRI